MASNLIDPVVKDYLFHDAPLRSFLNKVILAVIGAVLVVLAFFGWGVLTARNSLFEVFLWVPYSIAGSILAYLVISFLDRERRVRVFHFLTILSVLLVTGPVAAFLNEHSPFKLWTVGFFEEGLKILPVLLLAIYLPNLIRTRKDGLVYGALAGMGFNIIEIGSYVAIAIHDVPVLEALYMHSTRLGVWGFGSHIIWSAFVGLGIGYAAESSARGWGKWKRAILYFLLAALAHSLYDLGGSAVGMLPVAFTEIWWTGVGFEEAFAVAGSAPGPVRDGMKYGQYIWNLAFIVVLVIQTRRSFAWENKLQVEQLAEEDQSIVTPNELKQVKGERLFFKRRYGDFPKAVGARIVRYQNLLVMQKHTATLLGAPLNKFEPVTALRGAIQALRGTKSDGR
jgi:RsiW-degrading membrane proteinase PrsW (M82 family)